MGAGSNVFIKMPDQIVQTQPATTLRKMLRDTLSKEFHVERIDFSSPDVSANASGNTIISGTAAFREGKPGECDRIEFTYEVNYQTVLYHQVNFDELEVCVTVE